MGRISPGSVSYTHLSFILEDGTSTVSCFAVFALRILVSISAIGSLIVMIEFLLYLCWLVSTLDLLPAQPSSTFAFRLSLAKFRDGPGTKLDLCLTACSRLICFRPTSLLSSHQGSVPCMLILWSRYGRYRIFLNMHADVRRFCNGYILWWRT